VALLSRPFGHAWVLLQLPRASFKTFINRGKKAWLPVYLKH